MCKLNFKRLLASFFALLLCLSPVVVQADEAGYTIQDYAVQATYHSNNTISVNETIAVNFTESRHGIYRNIPLNMYVGFTDEEKAEQSREMEQYRLQVKDIQVKKDAFETSEEDENKVIQSGMPIKRFLVYIPISSLIRL